MDVRTAAGGPQRLLFTGAASGVHQSVRASAGFWLSFAPHSTLTGTQLVTDAVREKLLTPERLTVILEALIERQATKDVSVANRRAALETEIGDIGDKLARPYRAIEEGIVELDAQLKERIAALKSARDVAQTALERIAEQAATSRALTPERIAAFVELVREKIETADIQARKAYLGAMISEIRVGDDKIEIVGDKASLAAVYRRPADRERTG